MRLTKAGRINGRAGRYAPQNCNAYRTPEQLAELEACYQAIMLARGSKVLGLELIKLRNLRVPWVEVLAAISPGD